MFYGETGGRITNEMDLALKKLFDGPELRGSRDLPRGG